MRVNTWTVQWDIISGHYRGVAVSGGLTANHLRRQRKKKIRFLIDMQGSKCCLSTCRFQVISESDR